MTVIFVTDDIGRALALELPAARATAGLPLEAAPLIPDGWAGRTASSVSWEQLRAWRDAASSPDVTLWLQLGTFDLLAGKADAGIDALALLVDEARTWPGPVFVATLPPMAASKPSVDAWNVRVRQLVEDAGVKLLELNPTTLDPKDWRAKGLDADGVRLTTTGAKLLAIRWTSGTTGLAPKVPYVWRMGAPWRIELQLTSGAWVWALPSQDVFATLRATWLKWRGLLTAEARRTGVPLSWLVAFAASESAGDASAVSPKGAVGLFQLMPVVWPAGATKADMLEPARNARAAADLLVRLRKVGGEDLPYVASAYNCGPDPSAPGGAKPGSGPWGLCEAPGYISRVVSSANVAPWKLEGFPEDLQPKGGALPKDVTPKPSPKASSSSSSSPFPIVLVLSLVAKIFKWW